MLFPVTGTPPIQTVIMRNDTILGDMDSVSLYEEGNYSCVANGVYGSDRKNFTVTFKGKALNIAWQKLVTYYKQLLDEVFVISGIINVAVGIISLSLRLRFITLTETLINLGVTKTESNNCFIIH